MNELHPLQTYDYLWYILIVINVETDEGNGQNETKRWRKCEIGVAVDSWVRVQVELMAW